MESVTGHSVHGLVESRTGESDRANEYSKALATEARISVFALIDSKKGGSAGGET